MSDVPAPRPSQPIDRSALDRVLARAAELQGKSADSDPNEEFTEEQLVELGKEVGLDAAEHSSGAGRRAHAVRAPRGGTRACSHACSARHMSERVER